MSPSPLSSLFFFRDKEVVVLCFYGLMLVMRVCRDDVMKIFIDGWILGMFWLGMLARYQRASQIRVISHERGTGASVECQRRSIIQ